MGHNKRRKRNIYMHYFFIFEFWYATNYLLGCTERLENSFLKLFEQLSFAPPPLARYTCTVLTEDLSQEVKF